MNPTATDRIGILGRLGLKIEHDRDESLFCFRKRTLFPKPFERRRRFFRFDKVAAGFPGSREPYFSRCFSHRPCCRPWASVDYFRDCKHRDRIRRFSLRRKRSTAMREKCVSSIQAVPSRCPFEERFSQQARAVPGVFPAHKHPDRTAELAFADRPPYLASALAPAVRVWREVYKRRGRPCMAAAGEPFVAGGSAVPPQPAKIGAIQTMSSKYRRNFSRFPMVPIRPFPLLTNIVTGVR